MKMNERIRLFIKGNGWTYTSVANRAKYDLKKLSRQLNNKQPFTTDEYEQICEGLKVEPSLLYNDNFLESKKSG